MSNNVPYGPNGGVIDAFENASGGVKVASWCLSPFMANACRRGELIVPTVTVAIHVDLFRDSDENANIDLSDVKMVVSWSSSNTSCGTDCQSVIIDPINGSSGSLQAQALDVMLIYPGFGAPTTAHPDLRVNVSVGVGTSGKAGQGASWQRTMKNVVDPLAQLPAFQTLKIPDWAIAARYINGLITTPTIEFDQLQAVGGNVVSAATIGKGSIDCVPIARGLGARWWTLTAALPAEVDGPAVQFDLCPN